MKLGVSWQLLLVNAGAGLKGIEARLTAYK